jgi:branched-chain amino acid transport system substrate-binding protein
MRSDPSKRTRFRVWSSAVLVLAVVLAVAACGSSSKSGSGDSASTSASTTSTGTTTPGSASANVSVASKFVGGKAGAANPSASPITLGWVNSEGGGPFVFPEATAAAQIAVQFINKQLGGIHGHPLKLLVCGVAGQESQGQMCGEQMANNSAIKAVLLGNLFIGNSAVYNALGGKKPVIGSVSTSPDDLTAKDAYFLQGSQATAFGALGTFIAKGLKAKTAAVIYEAAPGADTAGFAVRDALAALGVKVKAVGYPPPTTSFSAPLTAAGAQTADVVVPMTTAPGCIATAQALTQLGLQSKPVATSSLCEDPAVVAALGSLPKWSYETEANPANPAGDPQVALYDSVMKQYGGPKVNYLGGVAVNSFGNLLTVARLLNELGPANITPAAIRAKVIAFHGPVFLGPPKVNCDATSPTPAICATQVTAQTYLGAGKWNLDGSKWYVAPATAGG